MAHSPAPMFAPIQKKKQTRLLDVSVCHSQEEGTPFQRTLNPPISTWTKRADLVSKGSRPLSPNILTRQDNSSVTIWPFFSFALVYPIQPFDGRWSVFRVTKKMNSFARYFLFSWLFVGRTVHYFRRCFFGSQLTHGPTLCPCPRYLLIHCPKNFRGSGAQT